MSKRVTSILGAGAVLDFDFEGETPPSTANITQKVVEQTIQGLDGEESDLIKKYHRLDIHNPGTLLSIMKGYSFMCAVIVDEAMERVDMLWDDGTKNFETYSFMSLEREESSGMYKKVINMVSKR